MPKIFQTLVIVILVSGCSSSERANVSENRDSSSYSVSDAQGHNELNSPQHARKPDLDKVFHALAGEWVSLRAARTLDRKRSVYAFLDESKGQRAVYLKITPDSTGYNLVYSYDLHDSGIHTIDSLAHESGEYRLFSGGTNLNERVKVLGQGDDMKLVWKYSTPSGVMVDTFASVNPSFEKFLGQSVMAGEYSDEDNNRIYFGEDGRAWWNGDSVNYRVGMDFLESRFDYFEVSTGEFGRESTVMYAYKWDGPKLYIYPTVSDDSIMWEPRKEPAHILARR